MVFARGLFLVNELDEGMLHQGIQAAGRLIEDKDGRVVHERADQPDFLFHSLGHPPEPAGGVELEPGDEAFRPAHIPQSPQLRYQADEGGAGHVAGKGDFPWQIPESPLDLIRTAPAVQAVHLGAPSWGLIKPRICRMVVVFPAPLGPRNPNTSPFR